jgi:hypothetical protein
MKRYYITNNKASSIIKFYTENDYFISDDKELYENNVLSNILSKDVDLVFIIRRESSIELIVKDGVIIPQNCIEFDEDIHTSVDKTISRRVYENLANSGINNPALLESLAANSGDVLDDSIEPKELIIMEKKNSE